jgi:hypothetical protein
MVFSRGECVERNNDERVVLIRVPQALLADALRNGTPVRLAQLGREVVKTYEKFEKRIFDCDRPGCAASFIVKTPFATRRFCSTRCRNMVFREAQKFDLIREKRDLEILAAEAEKIRLTKATES